MNTLKSIIAMARANPRWAYTALALDAMIGFAVAVGFIIIFSSVTVTAKLAVLASAVFAITGVVFFAYGLFCLRMAEQEAS